MKISTAITPQLCAGLENISRAISQYLLKLKVCRNDDQTMTQQEIYLTELGAQVHNIYDMYFASNDKSVQKLHLLV